MENLKETEYEICIWTSDIRGAGTDADVFIHIKGSDGDTGRVQLGNTSDNFEQGQEDEFKVKAEDVGTIRKVIIGHDGSNPMSGWHLNKILVKKKAAKRSTKAVTKSITKKGKPAVYDVNATDDYWFYVNRWFDTSEDDGAIERELFPTDETGNPLAGSSYDADTSTLSNNTYPTRPRSERSNLTNNNERSTNRDDPFYVASAYDKEPKDELESLEYHTQPNKPHFNSGSENEVQTHEMSRGNQSITSGRNSLKSGTSDRGTKMNNRPQEYSPIEEEDTQPMLTIHTEDQDYFTNDFQDTRDADRRSPSGMSLYFKEETTKGVVGSIRRTLRLFD